jgi:Domain of unknown function (DUF4372)/Transposase DDE domain
MHIGKTLFAQLMDFLPWTTFRRIVKQYGGDRNVRKLNCAEQFRAMAFAQLTYRESLRDIEVCLSAQAEKLYHMGFREPIKRATLADANERRDWRIYADFGQVLIRQARALYAGETPDIDVDGVVYALDSTTIDLCLPLFDWAPFRSTKAAIKLHTLVDLRGPTIPSFIHISSGKMHDVNALDLITYEPGAYYVFDRAYVDFDRLHVLHAAGSFFVTRAKRNMDARRLYSQPVDRSTGLICDQVIVLEGFYSRRGYPDKVRRIRYNDLETGKRLAFLTNNMTLPAMTVCLIYKHRWRVELFFKWIKQHLRVKRFFGCSPNAVKSQIWIAITVYLLIAIVKKRLRLEAPLYTLLQILSVSVFEKMPVNEALSIQHYISEPESSSNQLILL